MEEFDVGGAPVVFSDKKLPPKNPLHRPNISFKKFIVSISGFLIMNVLSVTFCELFLSELLSKYIYLDQKVITFLVTIIASCIYLLLIMKRAIIWLIHVYQHYAPDRVRLKCVFEPSCSEYMLLSIKKYGTFVGVFKGCLRLLRCHPPNGGKDYP